MPVFGAQHANLLTARTWRRNSRLHEDVLAFAGMQQGGQIIIITYNDLGGWIDGMKIAPFHGAPGQRCIMPGRDLAQRPIFEID